MRSLNGIKPDVTIKEKSIPTIEGDIGSGANVTVWGDGITVRGDIKRNAKVCAGSSIYVRNIDSDATLTTYIGCIVVEGNIGSGATVKSGDSLTVKGNIGSGVTVIAATNRDPIIKDDYSLTVTGNIGANATITIDRQEIIVNGNIEAGTTVTVHNGDVTVGGNIEAGAKITLEGHGCSLTVDTIASGVTLSLNEGLLNIKNRIIPPNCTIEGALNLSDYSTQTNDSIPMITTTTDPIADGEIRIFQDTLGWIWVNNHVLPGNFKNKRPDIWEQENGLFVHGLKIEISNQGLLVNGQLVVNGVVQTTPKPDSPKTLSHFSPTSPAFLAAPATVPNVHNESSSILRNEDADKENCCSTLCAVM